MTTRWSKITLAVLILILGLSGTYAHVQTAAAQPKPSRGANGA